MGQKKKQYGWRGLDLRTNILYRNDGTASDVRNLTLTPSRELRKRVDMATTVIPRAAEGVSGDFLNELPFSATIIDIMDYEDHKVLATKIQKSYDIAGAPKYIYVNKFYRWFPSTNTVEFIPFEQRVTIDSEFGAIRERAGGNVGGRLTKQNQENILYFSGDFADTDMTNTPDEVTEKFFYLPSDKEDNLSYIYTYDGLVMCVSGCPSIVPVDTATIDTVITNEEFVRILPFKIDAKNRHVFGNYSTHKTVANGINQELTIDAAQMDTTLEDYQVVCKTLLAVNLASTGDSVARTIPVNIFTNNTAFGARGTSVAVGQYLYSSYTTTILTPFTPPSTSAQDITVVYRATIEAVDYNAGTITIGSFKAYSSGSGGFEDSNSFKARSNTFFSNILIAIYGSDDFGFGFEFRKISVMGYTGAADDYFEAYPTTKGASTLTEIFRDEEFLFLNQLFVDTYAPETVKLPAPKVRDFTKYIGSFVAVDTKSLYFADISLGGNIETYTPFDTFPVGSSEFGPITGVFGNQTFLAVFRQEESYYISGNIFAANYRIQSYKSTRIGCSDPKSIIDYRGAGVFVSEKGVFVCSQGGAMSELSDIIEPLFSDDVLGLSLDNFNVLGMVDFIGERLLFAFESATESYLLEFSYYHKEWLLHDGIPMIGGAMISDRKLYTSDGTNVLVEAGTYTESDAYIRSNFETLGAPSLLKKFTRMLMFTNSMPSDFEVAIKTYKDWKLVDVITDETKSGEEGQVDLEQRFNSHKAKSVAIQIESPSGSPFISAGYEYEYGEFSEDYQNDD